MQDDNIAFSHSLYINCMHMGLEKKEEEMCACVCVFFGDKFLIARNNNCIYP